MKPELWSRAREVFERAIEVPRLQRQAYVAGECAADTQLRRAVDTLLAADEGQDDLLDEPPLAQMADIVRESHEQRWIGRELGPYRILEKIGEGGMGTVFLAERSDEVFDKRVAVKILRGGWANRDSAARFRRERQILAGLEHPNIARLLDGGETEDGIPFLVMELVDGTPITRYCDENQLALEKRIELFRSVCDAVRYAHQNLVVHRDLKAGNILVAAAGTPKLLDFGIAKLIDADALGPAATSTLMMTPDYASPEQAAGRPITTASDVYSLGVLLYELFTGRRPLHWSSGSVQDFERHLREIDPIAPSRALASTSAEGPQPVLDVAAVARQRGMGPDALRSELGGDLDNIVLRALRKEPENRYRSAGVFDDDLRRYLEGLPVEARPATLGYRAGKFLRRHRAAAAAAIAISLALVGITISMWINAGRLERERDLARRQQARAERIAQVLVDTFRWADPEEAAGEEVTARQILELGAQRVRLELTGDPRLQASLLTTIGSVQASLGQHAAATAALEEALRTWTANPDSADDLSATLHERAWVHFLVGEYGEAERTANEALETQRGSGLDERRTLHLMGQILTAQDRLPEALAMHQSALALTDSESTSVDEIQVYGLTRLGQTLYRMGAGYEAEAEATLRQALAAQRRLHPGDHPGTARILRDLVTLLRWEGRYEDALPLAVKAVDMMTTVYGEAHPATATTRNRLGTIYRNLGRYGEAQRELRRAIELQSQTLGTEHGDLMRSRYNLALLLARNLGRHDEAARILAEVVPVTRRDLGPDHIRLGYFLNLYGEVLSEIGRTDEALSAARESRGIFARGTDTPDASGTVALADSTLGKALTALGRYREARERLERAQGVLDADRGPGHAWSVLCAERRLALYEALGDRASAAEVRARLEPAAVAR